MLQPLASVLKADLLNNKSANREERTALSLLVMSFEKGENSILPEL